MGRHTSVTTAGTGPTGEHIPQNHLGKAKSGLVKKFEGSSN